MPAMALALIQRQGLDSEPGAETLAVTKLRLVYTELGTESGQIAIKGSLVSE